MNSQFDFQALFDFGTSKPIVVEPSEAQISSDAGLLPFRQLDEQLGFTRQFARPSGTRHGERFAVCRGPLACRVTGRSDQPPWGQRLWHTQSFLVTVFLARSIGVGGGSKSAASLTVC